VALELAVHRPDLVEALVVIAPGLPGLEWSEEILAGWAAEEEAFGRGDFEAAAEICVRMWVDGPSRSPSEVDQGVRDAVREMLLRSYAMQEGAWEAGAREELLEPSVADRLAEIRCPTLVLIGGDDLPEMKAIATRVAEAVSSAGLETVEHAAHLPSLESPDEVTALVLGFLDGRP
jgi:3-oxoadipate enol-lactonase